jgi:LmbE family N-acetylglucosaminyl deacetylase
VITVFTALPPAGGPLTGWDRLTGATSSRQRQLERLAEDEAAMAVLEADAVHLDAPDHQYRDGEPDLDAAAARMTGLLAAAGQVWLPAAIGGHPDHLLARRAGLRAAASAGHADVVLYADFPYVVARGWPTWVAARAGAPNPDADTWIAEQLVRAGLDPTALTPAVAVLSRSQRDVKARVIDAYRSQAGVLGLAPADLAADPDKLAFEVSWRMHVDAAGPLPLARPGRQRRCQPAERAVEAPPRVEPGELGWIGRPDWQVAAGRSGRVVPGPD